MFERQAILGDTVKVGDVSLTPQSEAIIVRGSNGGWVWHRPTGVRFERAGSEEYIRIVDVTRLAQLSLLILAGTFSLITLILSYLFSSSVSRLRLRIEAKD